MSSVEGFVLLYMDCSQAAGGKRSNTALNQQLLTSPTWTLQRLRNAIHKVCHITQGVEDFPRMQAGMLEVDRWLGRR